MTTPFKVIPLPKKNQPLRSQSTALDGTPFRIRFDWNSRTDRWSWSLYTADGTALIEGAVLVAWIDLFRTVSSDLRPGGMLRML